MNCCYCGRELSDKARVCYACGNTVKKRKTGNVIISAVGVAFGAVGIILWLVNIVFSKPLLSVWIILCLIIGIAMGIIGTVSSKDSRFGRVLGIVGLIISALGLIICIGFFILILFLFSNVGRF